MRLPRASGILLHPTSLPGPFGIGDLGPAADAFVDFLAEAGQAWWQLLPLGPTGYGNSPYQSSSSFAGNRLLISPEWLVADGFLAASDLAGYPKLPEGEVDYDAVAPAKEALLRAAFARFDPGADTFLAYQHARFVRDAAWWLEDYALFAALKAANGQSAWWDWAPGLVARDPAALAKARAAHAEEIRFVTFVQFLFDRQWRRLRDRCRMKGVKLIGDVPIYVAEDSADVWTRPELFTLDERGRPTAVAGVPPDYFSETGQYWGNPIYRWDVHAREDYAWWGTRLRAVLERVDLVRLDHFRGFEAYYAVAPNDARDARGGRWTKGPDAALLASLRAQLRGLPLIAEDLGDITPPVLALRDNFELPGMKILQFCFSTDAQATAFRPYNFPNHCVVYTGTHDNDTTLGWFRGEAGKTTQNAEQNAKERQLILSYLGSDGSEIHWDMIRLALSSVADTAILPMQDLLGLGSEARMNTPSVGDGNWRWRYREGQLTPAIRKRLAELTAVYGRRDDPVTVRKDDDLAPLDPKPEPQPEPAPKAAKGRNGKSK
jgi:4-alpha-glucanotransferase